MILSVVAGVCAYAGGGRWWWALAFMALVLNGLLLAWWSDRGIGQHSELFALDSLQQMDLEEIDGQPLVALVLGTAPTLADGRPNQFYWQRLRSAAQLYRAGHVAAILVSGDNGHVDYDEPTAMRDDLHRLGVPLGLITRDYAGFSTFDSVVRAKKVFGLERVLIVSQRFHVQRALFLAEATGLQAYGIDAGSIGGGAGLRVRLREVLARLATMGDLGLWQRQPRFLGPQEAVSQL